LAEVCLILPLHALLVTVSWYLILCLLCSSHEQYGQTAVYSASAAGHTEVVKLLVQAKADVEPNEYVGYAYMYSMYSWYKQMEQI